MEASRGSVKGSGLDLTGLLEFFFGTSGLRWEEDDSTLKKKKKLFDEMDTNQDGHVDRKEVEGKVGATEAKLEDLLKWMQDKGLDKIDFKAFKRHTGGIKPTKGRELKIPALEKALEEKKTRFSKKEWDRFGISDLRYDDFIHSKNAYFRPARPFTRHVYKAGKVNATGEETATF